MTPPRPLALIGLGCRFAGGARDAPTFWTLLLGGVDAIVPVPSERWNHRRLVHPVPQTPGRTNSPAGGFLEDVARFDAQFFGISPREARALDPHHRMLLEVAWEALEDAGLSLEHVSGRPVGVFMGLSNSDYMRLQNLRGLTSHSSVGTAGCMAANRISYALDLSGPSLTVDTACSASLSALHLACQSLWNGECSLALAGGVQLLLDPMRFVAQSQQGLLSPTGRCHHFDSRADGFVRGEGAGVAVLKPLDRALEDKDRVYAVVLATGMNQDGRGQGVAVPNLESQEALLRDTYRRAGVDPACVSYVEAHGTGTRVGDPIEAEALRSVLGQGREPGRELLVGSVKTNLGHLEAAAGVAGFLKAGLVLHRRTVPRNLHFHQPNPDIRWDGIRVPTAAESLDGPAPVVGVSSFGIGGTNVHVVLSAAPQPAWAEERPGPFLLPVSARSPEALQARCAQLSRWLAGSEPSLSDTVYTAACRRSHHRYRTWAVGDAPSELASVLRPGTSRSGPRRLAFVFSGQGSQWTRMGIRLLEQEPVFRRALEACEEGLRAAGLPSVLSVLAEAEPSLLERTALAQAAIFAVQVGLVELWHSWGIRPEAVVGHSFGEVTAAWASGMLDLAEACRLIALRGRVLEEAPCAGAMLAVALPAEAVAADLGGTLAVAAFNAPSSVTVSGARADIERLEQTLLRHGVVCRRVKLRYAFHSPLLEGAREPFLQGLGAIDVGPARIPMVSTVTGELVWHTDLHSDYWWRNIRQPVRFQPALERLLDQGCDTLVEVSPHPVLSYSMEEILEGREHSTVVLGSLRRDSGREVLLQTLGRLYELGCDVRWEGLYPAGNVVSLPGYPWQGERHWMESPESLRARFDAEEHPLLGVRQPHPQPLWRQELDVSVQSWLGDHRLDGAALLSGTSFLEMVRAAAGSTGLSEVQFKQAALLPEAGCLVVETRRLEPDRIEIWSHPEGSAEWALHCVGRPGCLPIAPLAVDPQELKARARLLEGAEVYRILSEKGFQFGETFRCVSRAWVAQDEALAEIDGPGSSEGFWFHPGLLDACLQSIGVIDGPSPVHVPAGYDRVQVQGAAQPRMLSYIRILERRTLPVEVVAQVQITGFSGEPILTIDGYRRRAVEARQSGLDSQALLYQLEWEPQDLPAASSSPSGAWLLLGAAHDLAARLSVEGASEVHVADCWRDVGHRLDSFRHVVLVTSLPSESVDLASLRELLTLTQALAALSEPPRLTVVTHRVAALGEDVAPAQAPLWGLARTASEEHPELGLRLVDVGPDGSLEALARELMFGPDGEEVALRGSQRAVHRYRRASVPALLHANRRSLTSAIGCFRLDAGGTGQLDQLRLRPSPPLEPGPGQVLVRVACAGLNFSDVMKALGVYPSGQGLLGGEAAGTVAAAGPDVDPGLVGQEVLALGPGAFGTHLVTRACLVHRVPEGLGLEAASTLPLVFCTAWFALVHLARLRPGERVLIHSASGGVGLAAVQIARLKGAQVLATAGTPEKRAYLRRLGIESVFASRDLSFRDEVWQATGFQGVDVVLNSLPGRAVESGLSLLRSFGRFVELGKRDIYEDAPLSLGPFRRHLSYFSVDLERLQRERPEVLGEVLREVMEEMRAGRLAPLPVEAFPLSQAASAFRLMAQAGHIGKIALHNREDRVPVAGGPLRLDPNAAYLITGGLGGFGLALAAWLAERGARHLWLVGPRGPATSGQREAVARLEAAGARVRVEAADVADASRVAELVRSVQSSGPPLGGVMHLALALEDSLLASTEWDSLQRVVAVKAGGAWNLHQATLGIPLQWFVLFSSVAAVLPAPGQGSYSAANSFLDALAHHRRHLGLPGLAINWGAIGGFGHLATHPELARQLDRRGIALLAPREVRWALDTVFPLQAAQVSVARIRWDARKAAGTRFRELAELRPRDRGRDLSLRDRLLRKTCEILQMPPERLDPERGLLDLGLDSLMTLELRNWVQAELGVRLATSELMRRPSLESLAGLLVERSSGPPPEEGPPPVAQLTEDQVDQLLEGMLAGGPAS